MASSVNRRKGSLLYNPITPYLLSSPAIVVMIIVLIVPMFFGFYISFTDASLLSFSSGNYRFVEFKNYRDFFTSPYLGQVLRATFVYVILGVMLTYLVGLSTALLLNLKFKINFLFRGILIIPWTVPQVVLALIWKWMLNSRYGVLNYLSTSLGLTPENFSWFTSATIAIFIIMLVTVWKQYPLAMLMLLAGLQSIPQENYEAASIDGANSWQRFRYITLPGLTHVTSVLVMLLTIWSFTNFTVIWLLTSGGPANSTATLSIFTYLNAFDFRKLGFGASVGVFSLLVTLIFTIIYYMLVMNERRTAKEALVKSVKLVQDIITHN